MKEIDLTKCRGRYTCKVIEKKRKRGSGEYYFVELEFPKEAKITIDMQLVEMLDNEIHKKMADRMNFDIEPSQVLHNALIDVVSSPFMRDKILEQL